jgi:hypothetical protein
MSFLSRLSARARQPGSAAPLLMPKGVVGRPAATVYREESAAEEQEVAPKRAMRASALRRQQPSAPEEVDAELPRATSPEQSEEKPADEVRPLRRAADTQKEPTETEEEARALRRAAGAETEAAEPEEEARALRRAAAPEAGPESQEEEEAVQPARLIRRAEEVPLDAAERPLRQPFQSDLDPGAVPTHPDLAGEEEPSNLQALRRDATVQLPAHGESGETGRAAQGSVLAGDVSPSIPGFQDRSGGVGSAAYFETDYGTVLEPRGNVGARAEPSPVIIDQLDVVIHEPAPSPSAARIVADHGRMLRARYLRRL